MVVSKQQLRWTEHFVRATDTRCVAALLALHLMMTRVPAEDTKAPIPAGDYAAALNWLGGEVAAAGKNQPLLIVWLFDESENMHDDRHQISKLLPDFYQGLKDGTETAVVGFGSQAHPLTDGTVTGIKAISEALDRIRPGGHDENMCHAVGSVVPVYSRIAESRNLRPVLVVVTDESPSDTEKLEDAIAVCRKTETPVFVLGAEAVFGHVHTRLRWVDPVFGLSHWVRINRGPDAASLERLNWNGFGPVQDNFLSGFGPHSQERLGRATGGGYFIAMELPDASGRLQKLRLAMGGYEPEWSSRREYDEAVLDSQFRVHCSSVIQNLNPRTERELNLRQTDFSIDPSEFQKQMATEVEKAASMWTLLNASIKHLESVRELRADETSKRWRANYDLLYGQCLGVRARLPQYLLALDRHSREQPEPLDAKLNRWSIATHRAEPVEPTADECERLKKALAPGGTREEFIDHCSADLVAANGQLQQVMNNHPGTPWATIAKWERNRGFAIQLRAYFHDPRYQEIGKRIKVPVL